MTLDLEWVRRQFPGLDDDLVFFENAGGSLPARAVVDRAHRYLADEMVQLGAAYPRSARATALVDAGKRAAEALLGAPEGSVALSASTTMAFYILSHAVAGAIREGDEVVITEVDHESNRGAWIRMAAARGATIREWKLDRDAHALTAEGLDAALTSRTRLVAFTHCANVVGTIHDAAGLVARIHDAGARAVVDGVAFGPHRRVDVQAIGADAYACSLYKIYGPHLGALYVGDELRAELSNQNHAFLAGTGMYELMPGNVSHELAACLPGIVDYLTALDAHHGGAGTLEGAFARIADHEARLAARLLEGLAAIEGVRIFGCPAPDRALRVPTVTFVAEGRASGPIAEALGARGVAIRAGHFYARQAMGALGVDPEDGVLRASLVHYNAEGEVDRFLGALREELSRSGA